MNLADLPMSLLAASGGDTVKLFDVSVEPGDPCTLSYTPSPGYLVNSVKWNHTNLVVASGGEDKRISLWRKNGQSLGTIPVSGMDSGDNIEESIASISFSNKGSRYICSGGSSQVVRIWDLQRKRCIKWLKGHTSSITGVLYNCKDEHLASISLGGNLILHNLASGARAAELKDPNQQVLRVLDYSRISRHLLVTAGDDGSIHLWDTTGRNPKVSWLKQHSAPTAGISFSPSNDKIIASVGLDKKLYTLDSGSRRSSSCISYEAPFSSLAFRDDGWTVAAGTSNGRVVFYDVRATPQPITILRAYSSSEAVTSLCWQRSKPVTVNENCSPETALLGGSAADSIVMPDPLPSVASSSTSLSSAVGSRNPSRSGLSMDASSLASTVSGSTTSLPNLSSAEETPLRSHLWPGGTLTRLHPLRPGFNLKDDMDVFSPVVEVQPITPSLDKLLDEHGGFRKENLLLDKKPSTLLFPSSNRLFPLSEDSTNDHPIYDWKSSSTSGQDDNRSSLHQLGGATSTLSSKIDDSSITPPEAWGGGKLPDRLANLRQPLNLPSRMGMVTSGALTSGSMFSMMHDAPSNVGQTSTSSLTNSTQLFPSLRIKETLSNQHSSLAFAEQSSSISTSISVGTGGFLSSTNSEAPGPASLSLPRRLSYAERISTTSSFGDGTSLSVGSPKIKKTGAETREELQSSLLPRSDITNLAETGILPTINGGTSKPLKAAQSELPQGNSFTLQLFQRTLEETLDSFQKSIHDDMRNLHIELIRQFHMQEMEFSTVMKSVLENQAELMKEVKSLRKENQELRQLL